MIVFKNFLLTIMLKIVNETTNFIKTVVFGKTIVFEEKNKMQLYCMSSYMKLKSCGGAKTCCYFLKNYTMISTDALQFGFLSSLTIVNETTIFIKTIVLKTTIFKKRTFNKTIVSFSIFRRLFHNDTIVFQKNENVYIPKCEYLK